MSWPKPNTTNSHSGQSSRVEVIERLYIAEQHRSAVLEARVGVESSTSLLRAQQEAHAAAVEAVQSAKVRLAQLESGRGAPIAHAGAATLYEFWLDLPGYSGPVRGMSASLTQHGHIQQVSDVRGTSSNGCGCATLGGCLGGPLGAILGALLGRKQEVHTDLRTVDHRQFELQVTGPGVAWSLVSAPSAEAAVRKFRDRLYARSTNTDDPQALAVAQRGILVAKEAAAYAEYRKVPSVEKCLHDAVAALESAWNAYEAVRPPLREDLVARWLRSSIPWKLAIISSGPILFALWLGYIVYSAVTANATVLLVGIGLAAAHLLSLLFVSLYFRSRVRLVRG